MTKISEKEQNATPNEKQEKRGDLPETNMGQSSQEGKHALLEILEKLNLRGGG